MLPHSQTPFPYFLQNGHFFHTFADFLAAAIVVRMENVGEIYPTFISVVSRVALQVDIQREYDLVQLIGEGWFSRVYLAEHRGTREEVGTQGLAD